MSDSDSVATGTTLRSSAVMENDLSEGIQKLNIALDSLDGNSARSKGVHTAGVSLDDYYDDAETENTTSETDTGLSGMDIFQYIDSDTRWSKDDAILARTGQQRKKTHISGSLKLPVLGDSSSIGTEIETLKRQVVQYRIKIKALTEIVKQINLRSNDDTPLIKYISAVDGANNNVPTAVNSETATKMASLQAENKKLTDNLEEKNKKLIKLKEELVRNKTDYETMLEEVNDYLQHNENISENVNEILRFLLENIDLTAEERDNLVKATSFESNFIDIKIKALSVNVDKIVSELKSLKEKTSTTPNDEPSESRSLSMTNNSNLDTTEMLDSRIESIIETMHEKYHSFLQSIQHKLDKNTFLENALKEKMQQQKIILESISHMEPELPPNNNQKSLELQRSGSDFFSSIDDLSKRASMDLSKSYQDHVDALNNMLQSYKQEVEDKDKELKELRSQLRYSYQNTTELDLVNKIKEQSLTLEENSARWHRQVLNYDEKIATLQKEKHALSEECNRVRKELQEFQEHSSKEVADLRKKLNVAMRKSSYYLDDNQALQEQLEELGNEYHALHEDNIRLRELVGKSTEMGHQSNQLLIMKSNLLDHLKAIFDSFERVLQKDSVEQAFTKIQHLEQLDSSKYFKKTIVKLDSVFFFLERAVNSIVTEHVELLLKEKDWPDNEYDESTNKQNKLKIEELRKKWIGERERRKLESEAATNRINMLQLENEKLREQLGIH